jgi:hypothetical protein
MRNYLDIWNPISAVLSDFVFDTLYNEFGKLTGTGLP